MEHHENLMQRQVKRGLELSRSLDAEDRRKGRELLRGAQKSLDARLKHSLNLFLEGKLGKKDFFLRR